MEHFLKKITPKHAKHVWTNWERFWAFFDFENFSKTKKTLDKKISRKIYPKTCSKHVWTIWWTILGVFGILQNFWFFETISKTRPSMEHWLKKFSKNLPQNTFKTIFDTFGNDFGHFWSFGNFLKTFRRLDPPWNTGQKNFSKKLPQNMFKTRLDTFGNKIFYGTRPFNTGQKKFSKKFFGHFGMKNFFEFYLKTFQRLDPPWNTGQKNFSKKLPQNMFKTRLGNFGNNFRHLRNFENFLIY